ncbi:MAG: hypothetical protein FD135_2959 [Comamonadaceae bacterium]|nr:MAG: hypothetical protein FD135_2959 [Comamonadaceae bacterium]
MNRCLPALLILAACMGQTPATAQGLVRQFPPAAKRAMLEVTQPPYVLLNGQTAQLSPGARIKGPNNLLVLSGGLVGQRVLVNYLRDPQGMIHEVWILNEQEAQEKRSGMETITNFVFGSEADKPKTDNGQTPFDQLPKFPQQ